MGTHLYSLKSNLQKMNLIQTHSHGSKRIWSVSADTHRNLITTCGADGVLSLYNGGEQSSLITSKNISSHHQNRTLRQVSFSPCGNYLAVAAFDSTISLWRVLDSSSLEYWQTLEGHENEVKSVSWSMNGQYLATCSRDKNIWIWEL